MTKQFDVPKNVLKIISILEKNGFEAYIVGGSVRDFLMNKLPADWDLTTNAPPQEIIKCFEDYTVIPTGLQYGTVSVLVEETVFEITTYRVDGDYSDHRRPNEVAFGSKLEEDLARRDFTVNAMAFNPKEGLIDFFGGIEDLKSRIIRAVGAPEERFGEDALRILRAVRFASQTGFEIEPETKAAIYKKLDNLDYIAAERIQQELNKAVLGSSFKKVFSEFPEVLVKIIPELESTVGFAQNSRYHHEDVYSHTLTAVANCPKALIIRLTMLLHDIGKPFSFQDEGDSVRHFSNHDAVGAELAEKSLTRLKYSNSTKVQVVRLIANHDRELLADEKAIKRKLHSLGEQTFRQLLQVQRADATSKVAVFKETKLRTIEEVSELFEKIIRENQCFSLEQLELNGNNLLDLGVPNGEQIGKLLERILSMVIDGEVKNENKLLVGAAKKIIDNQI